ncbi:MAG TPA: aminotransferase class I/II-fold pyridoxal phosphate-dependent enzyme [Feifaniaceae bacterium]|nr:aminotransferase class I/II-fold pyridoxal phosphate-dependent enzyme [Feifaniaceae bacterium]
MRYTELSFLQLQAEHREVQSAFLVAKAKGLKLDMSRGKPGSDQLDISMELLTNLVTPEDCVENGLDVRNYGLLDGLPSCKRLFAELLGVREEQVFIGGNASLQLMYDTIAKAYTHGLLHSEKPWSRLENVKFLCPVPGYDRHFGVSESFKMEMLSIPMTPEGPDMDAVEEAVKDPDVRGMWCVPKYSNPEGIIYSEAVIARIAALKPAAPDFILMWDNAYCVHEFDGPFVPFAEILSLCERAGSPDMVFEFASTSKITLPGAGVACMAASKANLDHIRKIASYQTIGFDKVNQLRHVRFLKNRENVLELMKKHAAILKPKFEAVLSTLDTEIAPLGIASWNRPTGGYFISLDSLPGCAKRTLALCKEAGVVMTSAGATHPYGRDPRDTNIRIAPTLPPVSELTEAIAVFCTSLRLAALEKLMAEKT